jgi:prepilin-type N-terminal cleavage/methylation domain-containing protein
VNNKGLTLVEVIVVMVIVAIITVAIGFDLTIWNRNYAVESQMKQLYSDLTNARVGAMRKNRTHFVSLASGQYTVYEDTNPWPDGNRTLEVATDRQVLQVATKYPIAWSNITNSRLDFTTIGLSNFDITKLGAICTNYPIPIDVKEYAYNDCIRISASRINMGQTKTPISRGGACVASDDPTEQNDVAKNNCVAK